MLRDLMLRVHDPMSTAGLSLYQSANRTFGNPIIFHLRSRGFFSEVNAALNAILYGLLERRRVVFDLSRFGGYSWTDFFTVDLPAPNNADRAVVLPDWVILGLRTPHFTTIRSAIAALWRSGEVLAIPALNLTGTVFDLKRSLTAMFCQPRVMFDPAGVGLSPDAYTAIQVRRGDKVEGYITGRGELRVEGELVRANAYLELMEQRGFERSAVFMMTDDYRAVEEFQQALPSSRLVTMCEPGEQGYRQAEFDKLDVATRQKAVSRLLSEIQVATASRGFIGPFRSNIALHIANNHIHPDLCFSSDSYQWTPL